MVCYGVVCVAVECVDVAGLYYIVALLVRCGFVVRLGFFVGSGR